MPPRRSTRNRLSHLTAATAVVLLVAACTAYQPGWTYDPSIGKATPGPSGAVASGALESPSTGPGPTVPTGSLAPSAAAGGSPGTAGGSVIKLAAKDIAFDQHDLSAPANTPFVIQFDNQDAGVPHNVAIYADNTKANVLFRGDVVTGPTQTTYNVQALPAGTYYFQCDVHPSLMNGTIVVH